MRATRAVLLGVAAWLAVVAVGSTAVWLVISRAGEDVGATTRAPLRAAATAPATPSQQRTVERPDRTRSSPAQPSATPAPPSATPSGSSTPATPATPVAQTRTWQGVGGAVTARCRGAAVSLVAAQPDPGFAVEVGDRGPDALEVKFEGREDEGDRKTELRAVCVAGVPRFAARTEGHADE
ncbi:hypothetical protein GCM10009844_23470 [Nocardioides koreensis]|uniref:Septum formation initiator n=1 Tax=Nocardioides koreensis TaxID=433651 RepID=A0ABP5LM87_9ACTN